MGVSNDGRNLYEILELTPKASQEDVEGAYKRLSYRLDQEELVLYTLVEKDQFEARRAGLELAYATLGAPRRRVIYDQKIAMASTHRKTVLVEDSSPGLVGASGQVIEAQPLQPASGVNKPRGRVRAARPRPELGERARAAAEAVARSYEQRKRGAQPEPAAPEPVVESRLDAASVQEPERFEALEAPRSPVKLPEVDERPKTPLESSPAERISRRLESVRSPGRLLNALPPGVGMSDLLEGASHFDGAVFARLREGVGASLEDIVQITKIKKGYLVALEQNNYAALPGAAYVRGFVGQYAQALGLNTPDVVESYMARYKRR